MLCSFQSYLHKRPVDDFCMGPHTHRNIRVCVCRSHIIMVKNRFFALVTKQSRLKQTPAKQLNGITNPSSVTLAAANAERAVRGVLRKAFTLAAG